jgi:hypothetical protein
MVSGAALETIFIEDMKPIYSTPILELRKKIEHGMVLRVVHCHALVLEQLNSTQLTCCLGTMWHHIASIQSKKDR